MADGLVVVASFYTLMEAQQFQSVLEEADIAAALFGENTVGALGGTSGVIPNVDLVVPRADLKRALDVVHEYFEVPPEEGWDADPALNEGLWLCPLCDEAVPEAEGECPYCATKRP